MYSKAFTAGDKDIHKVLSSLQKKVFLPFPGSLSQQPAKLLDIFDILESAEIKAMEK